MNKRSLESKLCFLIAGLLFALLLAVGHLQLSEQRTSISDVKSEKYESLSRIFSLAYSPLADSDNELAYRQLTADIMRADKDVAYVIVSDSKKKVLFAEDRALFLSKFSDVVGQGREQVALRLERLRGDGEESLERMSIPALIRKDEIGSLLIGFESKSIVEAADVMKKKLVFTFALALILGILFSLSLARTIAFPLKKLISASREIESGNLNVKVDVKSDDEIGELSHAFNSMVAAMRENRDRLVERANTDSLTDLYNHRYFQERLAAELSRAERYKHPLSLIMLDIDHFKSLNDTHGHPTGDMVLRALAGIMVSEARDIDIIARYGGEEFTIILPETTGEEALLMAERLRETIRSHSFVGKEESRIPVTVSMGISEFPVHASEREGLIMAADLAMYQAKSTGRNKSVVFANELRKKGSDPYKMYLLLYAKDMSTLEAIAAAIDAKAQRKEGSSIEVAAHCVSMAAESGLTEKQQKDIRVASLLHDIGKIGIPDAVLRKKEPLSEKERVALRSHPEIGYTIIQKSPHLKSMVPGILHHHENWDGTGYPGGLKGEDIPLIARIISVVDTYHEMIEEGQNNRKLSPDEAKAELKRLSGIRFDPVIVDKFIRILEKAEGRAA